MKFDAPTRALLAGTVWLAIGLTLVLRGLFPYWVDVARESLPAGLLLLGVASALGAAKGWFVLRRTSLRMLSHIDAQPGRQGLATLYPRSFLLLIPLMIALGFALRAGFATSMPALVAGVYLAVGAALLGSTRPYFRYWRSGGFAT